MITARRELYTDFRISEVASRFDTDKMVTANRLPLLELIIRKFRGK